MADFETGAMWRLADLTEMTLKLNQHDIVEGKKTTKFAVAGTVFDVTWSVIGSCWCTDLKCAVLLIQANRGSLGMVVGSSAIHPKESFTLVVDMEKVKDRHKFDSHTTLAGVVGSVGPAIARGFMQSEKETPWHERDMSEFAVA